MSTSFVSKGRFAIAMATIACLALAVAMLLSAGQANAKEMTLENAKGWMTGFCGVNDAGDETEGWMKYHYGYCEISSSDWNHPLTDVKVRNKRVVSIGEADLGTLELSFKRPGKTTVSYKWKGKVHKVKVKVYRYKNPAKSFKVGSKELKSKFRKAYGYHASNDNITGKKLSVHAAKGWKLKGLYANGTDRIKNGTKLTEDIGMVKAVFYNTKTKVTEPLYLYA